ncbi:hypothetical protein KFL_000900080 [Klebsormidium nitens]|uniref:Uncharacterized protein n=1 Tax=Klebsormidium nitens TaxID=105231 RepID=A0A0U9HUD3_KLENI|nr:hypothetical protein KFL_000900080 [Klebsormidium nitens]|eukprot:GAQ81753.1 hypothetical protein KFL_000900080 [Klebsormidium nitens]
MDALQDTKLVKEKPKENATSAPPTGQSQGAHSEGLPHSGAMGPPDSAPQEGRIGRGDTRKGVPEESKHAESRIRVITLEAARLRKELRDSEAKRQRAVDKCKEYEEKNRWGERAISELRYSNKQLQGELKLASEAAAASATRNRAALASLRAGLGAVEQAVAERAAKSHTQLQGLFTALQGLQRLVLQRASVPGSDMLEAQRLFAELVHGLGALGSLIGGGLHPLIPPQSASEPPTPAAPPLALKEQSANVALAAELVVLKQRMSSVEAERVRLSAEATSLREELARERTGEGAKAAALIPQYRMAVVKARAQASALRERLAEGAKERAALREEVESAQKALRESSSAQEVEQQREALQSARALSEAAAARQQLEADLQVLRKRLARLEADAERWTKEREALLVRSGELEQRCKQHSRTIRDLRALIADQRADAQFALEIVSKRPKIFFFPPQHSTLETTSPRPATASAVHETLGRSQTWLNEHAVNGNGQAGNGFENGLGAGLDWTSSGERSSEFAGKGRERHRYHRSRRRGDRKTGRDEGYASVPNPSHQHGLRRDEQGARPGGYDGSAPNPGFERGLRREGNEVEVDGYRAVGVKGGLGTENRNNEGNGLLPAGVMPSGFGHTDFHKIGGPVIEGRDGDSLPPEAGGLRKGHGLGPSSVGVSSKPEEWNGVNNRLSEAKASSGKPNGGILAEGLLDDLLLTETESERDLLGKINGGSLKAGNRSGVSPVSQSLPAGQWPSRGLEATAAAYAQPISNKVVGDRDRNEGVTLQNDGGLMGENGELGRRESESDTGVWKGAAAAAGSEELQKGMAALDREIADLQTSLQAASWRLQE